MNYLIEGILKAGTTNLAEIVHHVDYDGKPSSLYKRFQRFFSKEMDLSSLGLSSLEGCLDTLTASCDGILDIYFSIDRHNWKFGEKDNNLLVVHFMEPKSGIGFPVSIIDLNSPGNSSIDNRIRVTEDIAVILRPYIERELVYATVLGDREFIGEEWIEFLELNFNCSILRLKRTNKINEDISIIDIYNGLSINEIYETNFDDRKIVVKRLDKSPDRRDDCLALLCTDPSHNSCDILNKYSMRWAIERAFLNMESNGFNIKDTHMVSSKRIVMLMNIVCVAYYMSSIGGFIESQMEEIPIKKHGYRAISIFSVGRRYICRCFNRFFLASFLGSKRKVNQLLSALLSTFNSFLLSDDYAIGGVL